MGTVSFISSDGKKAVLNKEASVEQGIKAAGAQIVASAGTPIAEAAGTVLLKNVGAGVVSGLGNLVSGASDGALGKSVGSALSGGLGTKLVGSATNKMLKLGNKALGRLGDELMDRVMGQGFLGKTLADLLGDAGVVGYETKESVFDTGYIPTSDAAHLENSKKVTLSNGFDDFWEMIATEYIEEHAEKFSLHETMSEGVVVHAAGGSPIRVTLSGYLVSGADFDTRAAFLKNYVESFRVRKLKQEASYLTCRVRHTQFKLEIESIQVRDTVTMPDYPSFTLTGLAYAYTHDKAVSLAYSYTYPDKNPLSWSKR